MSDAKGLPKVVKITGKMKKNWGDGTLLVPAPMEVDEEMRKVPRGKLTTINDIRAKLAKKHRTTICCPITTGIFAWVAAHAAEEAAAAGGKKTNPYWRTLKIRGVINEKYPGGVAAQMRLLRAEGHQVTQKGKNYVIVDFEKFLIK